MAKKLILLLLIIPIVVMILLFAATQTLSNLVDVPVTGVEIIGTDEYVYLNLDKGETYTIEYAVYPTTAKNKAVSVSVEAFQGEPLAEFDFKTEDGKVTVTPLTVGAARIILTTVSGGFTDSIVIYSDSTKLQGIESTISNSELYVGDTALISTVFLPENPDRTVLDYVSSNEAVVKVTPNGVVRALSKGTATITIISEFDRTITDTVTVTVTNKDEMDLGVVGGALATFGGSGSIPISIQSDDAIALENLSFRILDENGEVVPESVIVAEFKIDGTTVSLEYEFKNNEFVGTITFEITFTHDDITLTKSCDISKMREIDVAFDVEGKFNAVAGTTYPIPFILTPEDAEATYSVTTSNDNITVESAGGGRVVVNAVKAGTTVITLTATNVADANQVKTASIEVVIRPRNLAIAEAVKIYGIEEIFTVGGYEFNANGELVKSSLGNKAFTLHYQTPTQIGEGFNENLTWNSSSTEVLIDNNGVVTFVNDTFVGEVEFWPTFSYGGVEETTKAKYVVRCIANGINVYSFADLYNATKATEHEIILQTNVKEDFGYINGEAVYKNTENPYYTVIDTTYDKTYYKNIEQEDQAKVKILLEFKNDLYGNGYIINAHNVTYSIIEKKLDNSGNITERVYDPNALFRGPLSFVAMNEYKDEGKTEWKATISVKAQDNICFALYEGVSINNVELRGCDLEGDADGTQDLVDLENVGTTVEILGDDVNIAYSRITNGRTVLRAFGDVEDSEKKIHVNITNSVLSGAREFIMRIGSNRFIDGTDDNISPNLPGDSTGEHNSKKEYHNFTEAEKQAYDEKYINTFVTVKNSVFKDSGIFAIGMDSHFAGAALHNGRGAGSSNPNFEKYLGDWYDLAKTSYGAKLRFEGEVELYNWKDLDDVDSSSLITIDGVSGFDMELNLKEMVETASKKDVFKNILTPYNGKNYVHAGIAFFGGGKNYSIFDSESEISLGRYEVSLSMVNKTILKIAAGDEDFYFFIYDKISDFTPELQEQKLADASAYDCIKKK